MGWFSGKDSSKDNSSNPKSWGKSANGQKVPGKDPDQERQDQNPNGFSRSGKW